MRAQLADRGVDVSDVFHDTGEVFHRAVLEGRAPGPDPQQRSYSSFASFSDTDGNEWVLQEMTAHYQILETRRLADDLVLGYHSVEFDFTDRPPLTVNLSLLVKRVTESWYIAHYQVSLLP